MQNTLTLIETETEDTLVIKRYTCNFFAYCDGSSIWSNTANKQVNVTGITVIEDTEYNCTTVNVEHDSNWEIYTDNGFEQAISNALGFDVAFTEQGMQEDNFASMEC
jgi:hypothetical protein